MKKRIIAICLTLVLALCLVPFAAAEAVTPEFRLSLEDHLLDMGYGDSDTRTELAVGDEIWITYQDSVPADVYVNGSKVHTFAANQWNDTYVYTVKNTGTLTLVVKKDGQDLVNRSFTVISSDDMYKKNVTDFFSFLGSVKPDWFSGGFSKEDMEFGAWLIAPFVPLASGYMLIADLFRTIFSFTRIVR